MTRSGVHPGTRRTRGGRHRTLVRTRGVEPPLTPLELLDRDITLLGSGSNLDSTQVVIIVVPGLIDHQYAKFAPRYEILVNIALAQHCPELTYVDVTYCNEMTDAAIVALAECCHALTVVKMRWCCHSRSVKITKSNK